MPRRKNPNIPDKEINKTNGYITWGSSVPEEASQANKEIGRAVNSIEPIVRSVASQAPPTITSRQGLSKFDYELFRPGESSSYNFRTIMQACMGAYERVSIVRNVIDLMGDFTSQGIRVVHPISSVEQFYRNWWKHVNANHISERFANLFYRTGNPIIRRNMAKVKAGVLEDLKKGYSAASFPDSPFYANPEDYVRDDFFHDYDQMPDKLDRPERNLIPWQYDFLNPLYIVLMGGDLALFSGKKAYGLEIPGTLAAVINNPKDVQDAAMVAAIPDYITDAVKSGLKTIPLDPQRISVYHYKKDSWQPWAYPLLYSVMDEIIILQKLKMADLAALDGACSRIRVWKLGNIDAKMFPTAELIAKLSEILQHAGNGQALDIIWGPDIDFKETSTDTSSFLGKEKYIPTLESIYAGLGVPAILTGVGDSGSAGTNSLSLKTLIERLNYGRDALTRFWEYELSIVHRAIGFTSPPPRVEFKEMILSDEVAQHHLLINLLDRDVISLERVREHFGYIPEIEEASIRKEYKNRESGKTPPKASSFHDANPELSLKKIFAQSGAVTPTQVGVELDEKSPDEIAPLDLQVKNQTLQEDQFSHQKKLNVVQTKQDHQLNLQKQKDDTSVKKMQIKHGVDPNAKPPGELGEGRPKNAVDTKPRKQRTSKASANLISLQLWASAAQETISDLVNPKFLKKCNKKNMRSLTTAEIEQVEHLKWVILCNIDPETKITEETIANILIHTFPANTEADNYWRVCVASRVAQTGNPPTVEEIKQIQSYVYALCKGNYSHGENND